MLPYASDVAVYVSYLGYAALLLLLWLGVNIPDRIRYRHIPGPFFWPFLGNLVPLMTKFQHNYFMELRAKYGPIFMVWYGTEPWVVICEADTIRKVANKFNNRWYLPHTLMGDDRQILDSTLLLQKADMWRLLKKAWDPAMLHRASLEGYVPPMQECADDLVARLEGARQRGEAVDIWVELSKMTLDAVGTCAFGIAFGATTGGWGEEAGHLQESCAKFFRSQELDKASKWALPVLMFHQIPEVFRWLANLLPDEGHKCLAQSMRHMMASAHKIIAASRQQRQAATGNGGTDTAASTAPPGSKGILPGSFVAQLEAWKAKHEGSDARITDDLLGAQVISFLLGGYETTANVLAMFVYHVSVNAEVQRKVQAELDSVLGGRKPTLDDLPKLVYLDACLKETQRRINAATYLARYYDRAAQEAVPHLDLLGYRMPPGARMCLFMWGLHQAEEYWERPQEFLPERFLPETKGKLGPFNDNAYLPFGAGGRKCTGYKFAEQEMLLVGAALLQRFSVTRPASEGPLRTKVGLTVAPIGGVKVQLVAR